VLTGFWNWLRTGKLFRTPYTELFPRVSDFSLDGVLDGLFGTLFSPGKGLIAYSPVLLLLLSLFFPAVYFWRHKREIIFIIGSLCLALFGIAGTEKWTGAGGWGIRFYVPWIPLLSLIILREWWRREQISRFWNAIVWCFVSLGLLINFSGLVTNFHYRQSLCGFEPWTWLGTNMCAVLALPGNLARVVGFNLEDVIVPGASPRNIFTSNRLCVWWYAIRTLGISPMLSWGIGLFLASSGIFVWWKLLKGRNHL
jgi:hypothetical protein